MKTLKHILFLLLLGHIQLMSAQQSKTLSMTEVDQITYQQYLKADWKNLVSTAEQARKNGIKFYFLDVREGIAYYHLKKYRKAISYLEKAFEKDEKNAVVAEYLYYAYVFGGRYLDALRIGDDFNLELKRKLGLDKNYLIDQLGFDFKINSPDDYGIDLDKGELDQNVITSDVYKGINIGNYYGLGNLLWLSVGQSTRDFTQYTFGDGKQDIEYQTMTLTQYYLAHYNQPQSGLTFGVAVNWLREDYEGFEYIRMGRNGVIRAIPSINTINEWVGFAGLRKDVGNVKLGVTTTLSNMQDNFQILPSLEFTYYPLSNTDIYFYSIFTYKMEHDDDWLNDPVVKTAVGWRLGKFYFEPSYTYGTLYNFVENDGLIVYNDAEKIDNRIELMSYAFLLKGNLKLYVKYQNYDKTNFYQLNDVQSEIQYKNNTITTGILWKF